MRRLLASVLFGAACVSALLAASAAQAASIAWITFHPDPNNASANAMAAVPSHSTPPDKPYTDLLTSNGHTVTRFLTAENFNTSLLAPFDLVIIGRSVNSGNYDSQTETAAWNGLAKPLITMGGYTMRSNRLGFTTGTTIPDIAGPIKLNVLNPSHPIFAGVALDGSNVTVNNYADVVTYSGALQRGISVNTNPIAGGGQVLATVNATGDPANGGMIIGYWPKGSVMSDTAPADTLGFRRLAFLSGSREANATSSETAGLFDLTPTGGAMFLNAVNFMTTVPEPNALGMAIFSLCGLKMARRRK